MAAHPKRGHRCRCGGWRKNIVDLPALAPGVLPFTCVMGMYSGNVIAIDAPNPANSTS